MSTLFTNGRIIDGEGGSADGHAVLIDGTRIERVAPAAEFDGFTGHVVDLGGGALLPGLIDCHVHLCYAGEPNPGRAVEDMLPGQITVRALMGGIGSAISGRPR